MRLLSATGSFHFLISTANTSRHVTSYPTASHRLSRCVDHHSERASANAEASLRLRRTFRNRVYLRFQFLRVQSAHCSLPTYTPYRDTLRIILNSALRFDLPRAQIVLRLITVVFGARCVVGGRRLTDETAWFFTLQPTWQRQAMCTLTLPNAQAGS